ncbi:hypothetical protein LTR66_017924, partial [Elasticomyces elasticus]
MDDVIGSVFAAIDVYHEEPRWTEELFGALRSVVSVAVKDPSLTIEIGIGKEDQSTAVHMQKAQPAVGVDNILGDLRARRKRKARLEHEEDNNDLQLPAPQRPWNDKLDGPQTTNKNEDEDEDTGMQDSDFLQDNDDNTDLQPVKKRENEDNPKLSKTHQLLLNIAKSTVPHLASPSPSVRHLLLDLLKEISPLLGRDESSYLPLINSIWPVVVPRLFAEDNEGQDARETAYNIIAAADTISVLCEMAGDFMASRIEKIFDQLSRMFRRIERNSGTAIPHAMTHRDIERDRNSDTNTVSTSRSRIRSRIKGVVDLQIVKPTTSIPSNAAGTAEEPLLAISSSRTTRNSSGEILKALVRMLTVILGHVQLTLDIGDSILEILSPYIGRVDGVRE